MAKSRKAWGIDIGQVALKALRCHLADDGQSVVADAYDYIEYPKILSQPEADAEELIREALEQFLSRNEVKGDFVAISVPGQAGLSRFFKPPPVNEKTLPDIVKFEVKQQIPFPIEDVIWDWQAMGGTVINNMTTDAEVGLFAMKRDAVFRALKPFIDAKIDVDLVQLAPLATYNVICHDVLESIPTPEEVNMDAPPESVVVVSLGTDTTDLIVTNGIKLWMRNIPIGGNHFTKQLSRELKLTLAKAEHLKRNARQAEDPKTVFQAMRPVFTDLVTEIQRSLSFFQSMEKTAKIEKLVLLGNAAQLPGLRQFMNSQLQLDIAKVEGFRHLTGPGVVDQPSFTNNVLSLAPCYGLCLQGLKKAQMKTNLLPEEFVLSRMVEAKKPWLVASVGLVMLGSVLMLVFAAAARYRVDPENKQDAVTWKDARKDVQPTSTQSTNLKSKDEELYQRLRQINAINAELASASDTQSDWMELISAIYQTLPADPRIKGDTTDLGFEDREEVYLDYIDTKYFEDLRTWYQNIQPIYDFQFKSVGLADVQALASKYARRQKDLKTPSPPATSATAPAANKATPEEVLSGPGWVIEMRGTHFHNSQEALNRLEAEQAFVVKKWLSKMITENVQLSGEEYALSDFGVFYPTLIQFTEKAKTTIALPDATSEAAAAATSEENQESNPNPNQPPKPAPPANPADPQGQANAPNPTSAAGASPRKRESATKSEFVVQFAWIPRSKQERLLARERRLQVEAPPANSTVGASATPAPANASAAAPAATNSGANNPASK
jgi:type IV pilus assembly protein PilM